MENPIELELEWGGQILPEFPPTMLDIPPSILEYDNESRRHDEQKQGGGPMHIESPNMFRFITKMDHVLKRRHDDDDDGLSSSRADRTNSKHYKHESPIIMPIDRLVVPNAPKPSSRDDALDVDTASSRASSLRATTLIVKTLQHWIRKFKARGNETTIRNKYYQIMMNLIFHQPKPLRVFFSSLDHVHILPKDSASESVCLTAHVRSKPGMPKGLNVFVKMTTQYEDRDKFKEIEPRLYREVINSLVQSRLTPHVMMYLGSAAIPNWTKTFNALRKVPGISTLRDKFEKEFGEDRMDEPGNLLVTECGQGMSLRTFMESHYQDKPEHHAELAKILFQVFYTLLVMDHRELTHYDLHLHNIFLEKLKPSDTPQTLVYFLDDHNYITLKLGDYFVRLFDWDMAFHKKVIKRPEKSSRLQWACPNYGMCNIHKSEYDLHKVLMLIYDFKIRLSPEWISFIESMYGNRTSTDLNKNLWIRRSKCTGSANGCRLDSLCNIQILQNQFTGVTHYTCKGAWKVRHGAISSSSTLLTSFVARFASENTFQLRALPKFDPQYLPGTFKWMNYVFGARENIFRAAQQNVVRDYESERLDPLLFE